MPVRFGSSVMAKKHAQAGIEAGNQVLAEMRQAAKAHKIDDMRIFKVIDEGMEANKEPRTFYDVEAKEFMSSDPFPDHAERRKNAELAAKLLDRFPSEKHDHTVETMEDKLKRLHEKRGTI